MVLEDGAGHAAEEGDLDAVLEEFLDLGIDEEARLEGVRSDLSQIRLDLLKQFILIVLKVLPLVLPVKLQEGAADHLGCLALHDDVHQVANLVIVLALRSHLVVLDEGQRFILQA